MQISSNNGLMSNLAMVYFMKLLFRFQRFCRKIPNAGEVLDALPVLPSTPILELNFNDFVREESIKGFEEEGTEDTNAGVTVTDSISLTVKGRNTV